MYSVEVFIVQPGRDQLVACVNCLCRWFVVPVITSMPTDHYCSTTLSTWLVTWLTSRTPCCVLSGQHSLKYGGCLGHPRTLISLSPPTIHDSTVQRPLSAIFSVLQNQRGHSRVSVCW